MEQKADKREYVKQTPYTPAPPRKPGQIERPHTPGTPQPADCGVQDMVDKVIEGSSGLP